MAKSTIRQLRWCAIALLTTLTAAAVADLQSDLREFQSLIPRRRIGYIAARHYIVDARFRSALAYVRGPEFSSAWQQIRSTAEFAELLQLMRRNGSSDASTSDYDVTCIIDRIPQRLRSFNLPAKVPVAVMFERNLSNFLSDAVQALPRQRIANLMARKVQEHGEFAQLYATLRSSEFKQRLQQARKSRNLRKPLRSLQQNNIDVDNIISIGFDVLGWGPKL